MQSLSFEMGHQPSLKLVTQHAESLLEKAENVNIPDIPVVNIAEAQKIKGPYVFVYNTPPQPEAFTFRLNKYDFF